MNPRVLCGMFAGVLLAFLFCALTMKAVGRAAFAMMLECRDQFDKMKRYLKSQGKSDEEANDCENWPRRQVDFEGGKLPDYANCVQISTLGAQKEMVVPSLLAIVIPIGVGLFFGVPGVMIANLPGPVAKTHWRKCTVNQIMPCVSIAISNARCPLVSTDQTSVWSSYCKPHSGQRCTAGKCCKS